VATPATPVRVRKATTAGRFAYVPAKLLLDEQLNASARWLGTIVCFLAYKDQWTRISYREMADLAGFKDGRNAKIYCDQLVAAGHLKKREADGDPGPNGTLPNEWYVVADNPDPEPSTPLDPVIPPDPGIDPPGSQDHPPSIPGSPPLDRVITPPGSCDPPPLEEQEPNGPDPEGRAEQQQKAAAAADDTSDLIKELVDQGISPKVAGRLVSDHPAAYVRQQWTIAQAIAQRDGCDSWPGLLRMAIEDGYQPPPAEPPPEDRALLKLAGTVIKSWENDADWRPSSPPGSEEATTTSPGTPYAEAAAAILAATRKERIPA
jgi:hypothetical protein